MLEENPNSTPTEFADDLGGEFDLDEEMKAQFEADIAALKTEAEFSEDLSSYASGFPDWDLLPPKKK